MQMQGGIGLFAPEEDQVGNRGRRVRVADGSAPDALNHRCAQGVERPGFVLSSPVPEAPWQVSK
jgi:hypothetical protein